MNGHLSHFCKCLLYVYQHKVTFRRHLFIIKYLQILQRSLLRLLSSSSGQSGLGGEPSSVSSAYIFIPQDSVTVGRSLRKSTNNKGPNIYPCGTPLLTDSESER